VLRRSFRIGLTLGVLGALLFALTKILGSRRSSTTEPAVRASDPWPPLEPVSPAADRPAPVTTALQPDPEAPAPARPAKSPVAKPATAWVEATDGVCPTTHPVKAKLTSKIFHLPGMQNYARTNPDRCYRDADSAEADGLRPAKR
jgi:hypothetical protein